MIQGILLGAIGGIIGLGLGYLACRGIGMIPVDKDRMIGSGGRMLVDYNVMIYVKGYFLAFGSALVASFFPAWSAGRLEPIDIIRAEGS
jgi:lipoprotein-releasing system permease protein